MRVSVSIGPHRAEMSKRRCTKDGWTIRSIEWRAVNARSGKGGHRERTWPGNGSRWKTVGYFRMCRRFARFSREKNGRLRYRLSCVSSIVVSNVRERRAIHIVRSVRAAYREIRTESYLREISTERRAHLSYSLTWIQMSNISRRAAFASVTRRS